MFTVELLNHELVVDSVVEFTIVVELVLAISFSDTRSKRDDGRSRIEIVSDI